MRKTTVGNDYYELGARMWEKSHLNNVGVHVLICRRRFVSNYEHFRYTYYIGHFGLSYAFVSMNLQRIVISNQKSLCFCPPTNPLWFTDHPG